MTNPTLVTLLLVAVVTLYITRWLPVPARCLRVAPDLILTGVLDVHQALSGRFSLRSRFYAWTLVVSTVFHIGIASRPNAAPSDEPRPGAIEFSNGKRLEGDISTTPGRGFRIYPDGESARRFTLDQVRQVGFFPKKEKMERQWRFTEMGSEEKEFVGEPFPRRDLVATVTFTNGETVTGRLNTAVIYLERPEKNRKFVLDNKQKGKPGQTFEDLVFIRAISFGAAAGTSTSPTDETPADGSPAGVVEIAFTAPPFGAEAQVLALTLDPLSHPKVRRGSARGRYEIEDPKAAEVHLAVLDGNRLLVGWPVSADAARGDAVAVAAAEERMMAEKGFFDVRRLHAARFDDEGRYLTALVSLTRKERKAWADMPWRASIWRWECDRKTGAVKRLLGKGALHRVVDAEKTPPPEIVVSPALWPVRLESGRLTVGTPNAVPRP